MDLGGRQSLFSSKSFISRRLPWRDAGAETSDVPKGPFGLSSPENAVTDLVFVHGLGGGSRSTWAKVVTLLSTEPKSGYPWTSHSAMYGFISLVTISIGIRRAS